MGKLFVVSTPIGNLEDITLRAIKTLQDVDLIACEDTRHTLGLLNHYEIKKPLISYHQHSKAPKVERLIDELLSGKDIALVTDAGTPGVSDPGELLIKAAISEQIEVVPIPGVSAVITALSVSGIDTTEFIFVGFLPHKKGRQTKLKEIATYNKTVILYESPYRINKLLKELMEFVGDRDIAICRELTKKFEEISRGRVSDFIDKVKEKGEFVVVLEEE